MRQHRPGRPASDRPFRRRVPPFWRHAAIPVPPPHALPTRGFGGNHSPRWGMGRRPICLSSTISGGTSPAERRLLCLSPKTGGMFPLDAVICSQIRICLSPKTGGMFPPAGLGRRLIAPACPFSSTERRPSAFSAKAPPKHGASTALNLMRSRVIRLRSTRSGRGRPRLPRRSAVRAGRPR